MLHTLAVANYRSINSLILPLGRLNLITGANGSGKSNLYRALRLLAETAQGGVVNALARERWAGVEFLGRAGENFPTHAQRRCSGAGRPTAERHGSAPGFCR